jgi:hypothetical protein
MSVCKMCWRSTAASVSTKLSGSMPDYFTSGPGLFTRFTINATVNATKILTLATGEKRWDK